MCFRVGQTDGVYQYQISRYLQPEELMVFITPQHPKGHGLVKKAMGPHPSMGHVAEGTALGARSLFACPCATRLHPWLTWAGSMLEEPPVPAR